MMNILKKYAKTHRSTKIYESYGDIYMSYHSTIVAIIRPNGDIRVNSGGYRSKTTKDRINFAIRNTGCRVFQQAFKWYISTPDRCFIPFEDNLTITSDGNVVPMEQSNAFFITGKYAV